MSHGADIQIVPELVSGLQDGTLPTLHGSRYFLFEPPHHIAPPGLLELVHSALAAGFVPVITHPERLTLRGAALRHLRRGRAHGRVDPADGREPAGRVGAAREAA